MVKHILAGIFSIFLFHSLFAQDGEVIGSVEFKEGLVQVGRPTRVLMEITHPEDMVVIFPDSAKDFFPWEVASTEVFPTRTNAGISVDAKFYYIRTFELDSIQYVELPFYYVLGQDTLTRYTNPDSIEFDPVIEAMSDTLTLKPHLGLTYVADPPDYMLIFLVSVFIFILLLVAAVLGYKPIMRKVRVWRLTREWEKVKKAMGDTQGKVSQQEIFIQELNSAWKKYLDQDRKIALRSLTSTEIEQVLFELDDLEPNDKVVLNEATKSMDMVLYAGLSFEQQKMQQLFDQIFGIMEKEFNRRKGAVSA